MSPERAEELFALAEAWRGQGATYDADELGRLANRLLQDHQDREAAAAERRRVDALPRHSIATASGSREVPTEYRAGIYAVHHEHDGTWAVTHCPSGWRVGGLSTRTEACDHADKMHEHAGDVGVGCSLGPVPPDDVSDALRAACLRFSPALVRT